MNNKIKDPVLFSGTLRFNLDPTGVFDDAALWTALEHSNLRDFVKSLPDGLEHHIDEGGDNIRWESFYSNQSFSVWDNGNLSVWLELFSENHAFSC